MGSRHYTGRPRRPTEREVEARQEQTQCPHAEFRARYGWPTCRVCGAPADSESVGVGCAYGGALGGPADPGQQGLGGVHTEKRGQQTLSAGAVA